MAFQPLQTDPENHVNTPHQARTIYDAGYGEIFWKSLVAGMALGFGRMISTVVLFGLMAGIFVAYVQPWLTTTLEAIPGINLSPAAETSQPGAVPSWMLWAVPKQEQ